MLINLFAWRSCTIALKATVATSPRFKTTFKVEADNKMKLKIMKKADRFKLKARKRLARNANVAEAAAEGQG